jgi:molybdenum cofactor biosynthesis enzyme
MPQEQLPTATRNALRDIANELHKLHDKAHDQVLFQEDTYNTPVNEAVRAINKALSVVWDLVGDINDPQNSR